MKWQRPWRDPKTYLEFGEKGLRMIDGWMTRSISVSPYSGYKEVYRTTLQTLLLIDGVRITRQSLWINSIQENVIFFVLCGGEQNSQYKKNILIIGRKLINE